MIDQRKVMEGTPWQKKTWLTLFEQQSVPICINAATQIALTPTKSLFIGTKKVLLFSKFYICPKNGLRALEKKVDICKWKQVIAQK